MQVSGINAVYGAVYQNSFKAPAVTSNPVQNQRQVTELTMPFYRDNINFTRSLKEHRSWGGRIDPDTKRVSFKILTYPDVKSVDVKIVDPENENKVTLYSLENKGEGVFETAKSLSPDKAKAGDRYSFVIIKKDGTREEVKDPYSLKQGNQDPDKFLKYSILYDNSEFQWQNTENWKNSSKRITRNPKDGGLTVRNASIYEMHTDTFTDEGTFEAAKKKLADVKKQGFNTIELMPNENTYSFNWGYDGVDKFAVPEHRGGNDKLKELIDYAHGLEMNVIMDYVPNHLGPDGAQLKRTGPYIKGTNAFGEAFNFEGENSKYVRDYIVNAGMNWIDNYHVDGLRLDMTKFMESDFTMKEIAAEINYHFPDAFLIAEDSREGINVSDDGYWQDYNELHDKRVVNPLSADETCEGKSEKDHEKYIDTIDSAVENYSAEGYDGMLRNLGYNSEWDFKYHHTLNDAIYVHNNMGELMNAIYHSQNAVKYVTSHDETGNMDGTRPVVKYMVPKLNLNSCVELDEDDIERADCCAAIRGIPLEDAKKTVTCQKAQSVAETLTTMLCKGELDEYKYKSANALYVGVLKDLGISKNSGITYRRLASNFKRSVAQHKMAQALTYAIPGPKMVFQGDENLNLAPFRFFRQFEYRDSRIESYMETEKGYKTDETALNASKLDSGYSKWATNIMSGFQALTRDLNKLNAENPALTNGYLALKEDGSRDCVIHSDAIGLHTKDEKSGNEFFIITNFKNEDYPSDANNAYNIHFPEGKWVEVLNTDDTKYGGSGRFINSDVIEGKGIDDNEENKQQIKLGEYSTIYFKRID